ncbi:magnesium transporter MgtE N-terminal domain-containing protein [Thiohalocapsa sp. ML1]|uniref:magnesium transporter MgtE N-terminal domain-containing protein n=1 Tax=Thiohalocapsa sp. ML1 TaxID=1431688 RepID=UPI00073222DC|nr:hypothetical protein [Thiohalocapsa sp. ML1]
MPIEQRINWHRWFGIGLTDRLAGTPWRVELEKEMALKSQRLDVVIIERADTAVQADAAALDLPDGLDDLRAHNLLTYKSQQEALDAWALDELIGHYVNYRKLLAGRLDGAASARPDTDGADAPSVPPLPPEAAFQLYAVATREPAKLLRRLPAGARQPAACAGVHDLRWGGRTVRLIVLDAVADAPRNALWQLFSARLERVRRGIERYRGQTREGRHLLYNLFSTYRLGFNAMTYTVEDFNRETRERIIADLTPEERLAVVNLMPPEERLALIETMLPEERFALIEKMPPEERFALIERTPPEERRAILAKLPPEERLRGLDPDQLAALDPDDRAALRALLRKLDS